MVRVIKFTDTSVFQKDTVAYFKQLRRWGARFNFTKLTEGVRYVNPYAFNQIHASHVAFGKNGAGVYHFWHGESAAFFLHWFHKTGMKASDTKFALDVEALELRYRNNMPGINAFFRQLIHAGFRPGNLWVYCSTSWIQAGWIKPVQLHAGFVWVAMYPSTSGYYNNSLTPDSKYRPNFNAWQFSGIAVGQDWSFDYSNSLLTPNLKKKIAPKKATRKGGYRYLHHGHSFTTLSTVNGYDDDKFQVHNGLILAKGSKVPGQILNKGSYTRIKSKFGYFTANRKYMKSE